jgi:hypothetical protein
MTDLCPLKFARRSVEKGAEKRQISFGRLWINQTPWILKGSLVSVRAHEGNRAAADRIRETKRLDVTGFRARGGRILATDTPSAVLARFMLQVRAEPILWVCAREENDADAGVLLQRAGRLRL